jgi:hypothetical protein
MVGDRFSGEIGNEQVTGIGADRRVAGDLEAEDQQWRQFVIKGTQRPC